MIPEKLKQEILADDFYKKCCIADETCKGRIEFHHNLIFAGKQVNEKWAILPVCHSHHEIEKHKEIGHRLDKIMFKMVSDEELKPYCKAIDYIKRKHENI